jgi:cell division protein ZapA
MNMITVRINGVEYNLKGEENEEYLHKVASYVDRKIRNITGSNNKLSTTAAAVLTAVNVVDDLFKCDNAYSELIRKVEELEKNEAALLNKIETLNKQIVDLEAENKSLKSITNSQDMIAEKDIEIQNLSKEIISLQENIKLHYDENATLKSNNKELKFQLQSAKYKIIGLQNQIVENQIDLAKVKRSVTPYISNEKK